MATNNNNSKQQQQQQQQRKRKLGSDVHIRDSPYFKIRALVSLLRPRFIQVLRTPDFQKCKAATEIQEGMELVMDSYRQMLAEGNKRGKIKKSPQQLASAEQNQGKENLHRLQGEGQKASHQAKQVTKETVAKKLSPPLISSEMPLESGGRIYGSYIVGGSLSGWNFITFTNRIPPQYYGVTKETHRSNRRNA